MRIVDFIEAKRDGKVHSADDIHTFTLGFTRGEIPAYQASAWLMAVCIRGLSSGEMFALTDAMIESGCRLDLSSIPGMKLDKHSTGGVGDKVTLAVVPLLAAAGVPIAKLSGRGLGFTGGTIDKLESIPGFNSALSQSEIIHNVATVGACICSQTGDLTPADGKLYSLRDVTGTVESIPLIASSIMSKKIAAGADVILLDVKIGRAAFMKNRADGEALAEALLEIGERYDKKVSVTLTSMDAPLGRAVGNFLEAQEAVSLLKGENADPDFEEETLHFVSRGLSLTQKGGEVQAKHLIESGAGFKKFCEIIKVQGGNPEVFETPKIASHQKVVSAEKNGYVYDIDALAIGKTAMRLGAGREELDDKIDSLAGIIIHSGIGIKVKIGDPLAVLYTSKPSEIPDAETSIGISFTISDHRAETKSRILGERSVGF
jgi:pyrimidine-nucleoside phosphorylase